MINLPYYVSRLFNNDTSSNEIIQYLKMHGRSIADDKFDFWRG
jgi:hypothetical protein